MAKRQAPKSVRRGNSQAKPQQHPAGSAVVSIAQSKVARSVRPIGARGDSLIGVRKQYEVQASYEAAGTGKRGAESWKHARGESLEYLIGKDLETLRRRCRYEIRNNPIAAAIVDYICATTVGKGIRPSIKDAALLKLWNEFVEEADADGRLDFYQMQDLALREIVSGGEVFARLRDRFLEDGLPVPLQIQLLQSEMVPLHDDPMLDNDNFEIVSGVKFGPIGQPVEYLIHPRHPGSWKATRPMTTGEYRLFPADRIAHAFSVREAGQVRGEPWLVRAIIRLHELDEYEDAELVKKNFTARITSIYKKTTSDKPGPGAMLDPDMEEDVAEMAEVMQTMRPGDQMFAPEGWEPVFPDTHQAGSEFPHYVRQILTEACAGLAPIDLVLDGTAAPERTLMMALKKHERVTEQRRKMLVRSFCRPIWIDFLRKAVASGAWTPPAGERVEDYFRVRWVGEPLPSIRRLQEAQADTEQMRNGTLTHAEAIERSGQDYETTIAQLDKEARDREDHRLVLTMDARHVSDAGVSQANDFFENEEDAADE